MTAKEYPKQIWLQSEDGKHPDSDTYYGEGMTWCEDKLNKDDVKYIRADQILSIVDKVVEEQVGKWHDPHSVSAIILLQARIKNEIGE